MISVLVYGRNDTRGYGMQKRVAISLNTIAEVLSAPTSEIIFVDYNTPNHLPTLPELIRDMLTEKARLRTRVLRVRPHVHARFAPFSPLPVLEPIARNIGLRRSRPQNRWILSTNTDAIFVPPPGQSLCDVVRDLPGTHYGAPRFELPERMWEALDRLDPVGTIATVSDWGVRARLNEVVRGQGAVQFDNPGDFQLVRRSILFALDAFDEEALLGWHVDQNLAHRIRLKYGEEGDLSDRVKLYHCSHARQPTATHSQDRVENDVQRFVHDVREPTILRQRDVWGCIDDHVGEVDLRQPTTLALLDAIDAAVAPLADGPLTASYSSRAFDSLWYDAGHAGVYLLDLLSTFPRGVTLGFAGCRRDMLDMLASGLVALGFTEKLVVAESGVEALGLDNDDRFRIWPSARFAESVDVMIFEFGLLRDQSGEARVADEPVTWTEAEEKALEAVAGLFQSAVQLELDRGSPDYADRMLVTVNAVNSRFERLIVSSLDATPSPYTTRLRYGAVLRAVKGAAQDGSATQRTALMEARLHLAALLRDGLEEPATRLNLASHARVLRKLVAEAKLLLPPGVTTEEFMSRLAVVQAPPPEIERLPRATPEEEADDDALSHAARLRDFENPAWIAAARRISPVAMRTKVRRDAWIWERAQIVRGLEQLVDRGVRGRALLVAEMADDISPVLADMFTTLDLVDVRNVLGSEPAALRRAGAFSSGPHIFMEKMRVIEAGELAEAAYDAIVIPHGAAFRLGVCGLAPLLARLRPAMKTGSVLVIASDVAMTDAQRNGRPGWSAAGPQGFSAALDQHAGLRIVHDNFTGLDADDVALVGSSEDLEAGLPVLGVRRGDEIFWPAVWFFKAQSASVPSPALEAHLADLVLGDQMQAVSITERTIRLDHALVSGAGQGEGHIFFGPYLKLPEGAYVAQVIVAPGAEPGESVIRLVAEVALGSDILIQQELRLDSFTWDRPALFELPFHVPAAWGIRGEARSCEIRLWTNGGMTCEVRSILVTGNPPVQIVSPEAVEPDL